MNGQQKMQNELESVQNVKVLTGIEKRYRKRLRDKKYRMAHPEKIKKYIKRYKAENAGKIRITDKKYRMMHLENRRASNRRAGAKRRSSLAGRIGRNMSAAISSSLKKGSKAGRHWETIVGYTVDQLKKHLEKKFAKDMTWENYGNYWWLDHIIPISAFNYEKPEDIDFERCWSLKNLRPLKAIENIQKGIKINKPFQRSLIL